MSREPRFGPDGFPVDLPSFPALAYSFYSEVAADARRASHLYWQRYGSRKRKDEKPTEPMNGEQP